MTFLLHVPLITLFVLAGLGPFALRPGEQLLSNPFDLRVVNLKLLDSSGNPKVMVALSAWYLFGFLLLRSCLRGRRFGLSILSSITGEFAMPIPTLTSSRLHLTPALPCISC